MSDEPWTIERMRRMTREQFNERIKRGDLPPTDVAVAFMQERLEHLHPSHSSKVGKSR